MKRAFLALALLAAATSALAQSAKGSTGIQIHLGYGFTPSFDAGGDSRTMSGPEFGVAFPIGAFAGNGILLEPSYYSGGRFGHRGDDDADVYRLTLFAHRTFAHGFGARIGVGYSNSARSHGGDFNGDSDVVFDFGVELPFDFRLLKTLSPYVDVHGVVAASHDQLNGVFVGLGVRL